jgi:hypothetical protein
VVRFFVVGFFFVITAPFTMVPIPQSGGKVLEVMAVGMLVVIVDSDGMTMVLGMLVIAEEPAEVEVMTTGTLVVIVDGTTVVSGILVITEESAEVVVVLVVIVADAARTVILPDIVIVEKVAAALFEVMTAGMLVVIVDGRTMV